MDQSPNARILQARFDKRQASKLQQWYLRISAYLQQLKCCVGDTNIDKTASKDFTYLPTDLQSGDCIVTEQEIPPPDLVEIESTTLNQEVTKDDSSPEAEDSGQIFNTMSLKDLASDAYINSTGIKRRRRRHQFYQAAYCGRYCDHRHYHYVQTEKLTSQLQSPFYTV